MMIRRESLLFAATVLAAACAPAATPAPGAQEPAPAPAPQQPAAAPAPAKPGEPQPVYGGKFRWSSHKASFKTIDPHVEGGISSMVLLGQIYNSLMKYPNTKTVGVERLLCDLCDSWTQPNPTTYVFKLHKGVRFHDKPPVNGREMTADDVVYSLTRMQDDNPKFRYKSHWTDVASIEAPDKYTVQFKMKRPSAPFLWFAADTFSAIVPKEAVEAEKKGLIVDFPIGTGPFTLESHQPKVVAKLKKNTNFFRQGRPYLDETEVWNFGDTKARMAAFLGGRIDEPELYIDAITAQQAQKRGDLSIDSAPGTTGFSFVFNVKQPPFDDVRVRRAIAMAWDREAMNKKVFEGDGTPEFFIISALPDFAVPSEEFMGKKPGFRSKEVDRAEAKKLLQEAGLGGGFSFSNVTPTKGIYPDIATALQADLRQIGIDMKIDLMDQDVATQKLIDDTFEAAVDPFFSVSLNDPDRPLGRAYSGSGENWPNYDNPTYDELYLKQRAELDNAKRKKLARQMVDILERDVPAFAILTLKQWRAWPSRCHNVVAEPRGGQLTRWVSDIWCERG